MTDTKIFVSKDVHGLSGVTASYNNPNASFLKVVAVRTFSTMLDGTVAFTDGGITDIVYTSEVIGTIYKGNVSSITSSWSDRLYVLEVSNIFGNLDNSTLHTDVTSFKAGDLETDPITFEIDTSVFFGPTNTVQLDFYRLLRDVDGGVYKHDEAISFVR
jgi:hypothetical protein